MRTLEDFGGLGVKGWIIARGERSRDEEEETEEVEKIIDTIIEKMKNNCQGI